ncbi:O-antigen ligase family protein, partial [Anaerostipes faecalis]|uniref:O-antigen ligase family protein n=1 Tax=Anaerostipes faecalis TaxID=2738446 RepID=UPI003EFDA33B
SPIIIIEESNLQTFLHSLVIFNSIAICINSFALGLSNSRTCIIAVSISVGMLAFLIFSKLLIKVRKRMVGFFFSTVMAVCICFISIGVLFSPIPVYEYAIEEYNSAHKIVYNDGEVLDERLLQEDDGTLTDRTLIWKAVFRSLEDDPKLFLYGVSSGKKAPILNVYPDAPAITTIHAHNSFIEVLRIQGLPALLLLIVLILFWMRRGIQYFFDVDKELSGRFLMTIAAAALIIGIVEPVPFPTSDTSIISLFFFYNCGFCSRDKKYF